MNQFGRTLWWRLTGQASVTGKKWRPRRTRRPAIAAQVQALECRALMSATPLVPGAAVSAAATSPLPLAPTSLTATAVSSSQINLSWQDNSVVESGYRIERKTGAAGVWSQVASVGSNVTSWQDTGRAAATTYGYRVRAWNAVGTSAYTSEVSQSTLAAAPTNDNFAGRRTISGLSATATGTNISATKETGEPNHASIVGGRSVWWSWTATSSGRATIDTVGSGFDTILGVYTGSSVSALTRVDGDDDSGGNQTSRVTFDAVQGRVYAIAVDGNGATGDVRLNVSLQVPPLPAAPTSLTATTVSSSQINLTWQDNSAVESGYYIDRKQGFTGLWTQVASVGSNVTSWQDTGRAAGTTYMYRVRAWNTTGSSGYSGQVSQTTAPANDSFAGRRTISGTQVTMAGTNLNATSEVGEPAHAGDVAARSVWWTWTATTGGAVQIDTNGSDFNTTLGVYIGSSVSGLTEIASDKVMPGNPVSLVAFNAVAGRTYQIAVDGRGGASGNITLNVRTSPGYLPAAPSNLRAVPTSTSQVTLEWTDNSAVETAFRVERRLEASTNWESIGTAGANVTRFVDVGLTPNTRYVYRVRASNSSGNSGYSNSALATTFPPPSNDNFANRERLVGNHLAVGMSIEGSTTEAGEVNPFDIPARNSVWFTWTATSNSTVTIDTGGSQFDTRLAVYVGDNLLTLGCLIKNDESVYRDDLAGQVTFDAIAGMTYQISVAGSAIWSSRYVLTLNAEPWNVPSNFDIWFNATGFTPTQRLLLDHAAARWSRIITADLPDVVFWDQTIDDLVVNATVGAIDGTPSGSNILANARYTALRDDSQLPYAGELKIDSADIADMERTGTLLSVMTHELGHVLGIGDSLWKAKGLLRFAGSANPAFLGRHALWEYNRMFGTHETSVPVEGNTSPVGSRDSHWRESVLTIELMTPSTSGGETPISRVTVASLADLGYTVNMDAADPPWFVPLPQSPVPLGPTADAKPAVAPAENTGFIASTAAGSLAMVDSLSAGSRGAVFADHENNSESVQLTSADVSGLLSNDSPRSLFESFWKNLESTRSIAESSQGSATIGRGDSLGDFPGQIVHPGVVEGVHTPGGAFVKDRMSDFRTGAGTVGGWRGREARPLQVSKGSRMRGMTGQT